MTLADAERPPTPVPDAQAGVLEVCRAAKEAARRLATASRTVKDTALLAIADDLVAATDRIVAANTEDLARGECDGLPNGLLDRLRLDAGRIAAIADAVRDVAALPDPVGEVVRGSTCRTACGCANCGCRWASSG